MSGIIAYVGKKEAYPILMGGLRRLEYRGYDSTGLATMSESAELAVCKTQGKIEDLESICKTRDLTKKTIGMAHTRWATHGEPNEVNAHPHYSQNKEIVVVHNGIIENYSSLRKLLTRAGYESISDTDTEVLANAIEYIRNQFKLNIFDAVIRTLRYVVGAYAICVIDKNEPDKIIAAKKGSELLVGIGEDEFYISSEASAVIEHTKEVIYLGEEEVACIQIGEELKIKNLIDQPITHEAIEIEMDLDSIEKGGFPHFMLKEIFEQPKSLEMCMNGRLNLQNNSIQLRGIYENVHRFKNAQRILITACGTSMHAGLIGKYLFEELCNIPTHIEVASELRYRNPVIYPDDIIIPISQSGETADTLAAMNMAKEKGAYVYGICNVVGSSIPRGSNTGTYTHAGPEIGIASTKAFTTQVTVLIMMALSLGKELKTISNEDYYRFSKELGEIPGKINKILEKTKKIEEIAKIFTYAKNFLYLGRGYNYPVALEGALKLKEISYIHAEGYPAAEIKHGPIALVDEEMPIVVIAPNQNIYDKVVSNVQEVKARKGRIFSIITEGDVEIKELSDYYIEIPYTYEPLSPILSVIPLQILAYYVAVVKGRDVDRPRNLVKSVTVE